VHDATEPGNRVLVIAKVVEELALLQDARISAPIEYGRGLGKVTFRLRPSALLSCNRRASSAGQGVDELAPLICRTA